MDMFIHPGPGIIKTVRVLSRIVANKKSIIIPAYVKNVNNWINYTLPAGINTGIVKKGWGKKPLGIR